jgi:hypothetical protein
MNLNAKNSWMAAELARRLAGFFLFAFLLCGSRAMLAQYPSNPYPDQNPSEEPRGYGENARGMSAGGNWTQYSSEDRMTSAHRTRFELSASNAANSDDQAKIRLYCSDGKLTLADFHPRARLSRPNWPGFWGQPQMHVLVRVDDKHDTHNWNWIRGHFLAMDKGTTREMIGAHLFRVEFQTPGGPEIAEFSPTGLDFEAVKKACGLTPKKP